MPTYRNDSISTYFLIENLYGIKQRIAPGESIETYRNHLSADLTKTSDNPVYNLLVASESVTSSGEGDDQEVEVESETVKIEIINKTEVDATVFLGSASNTPGIVVPESTFRTIENIDKKIDSLIIRFPASVSSGFTVQQFKE